MIVYKQNTEKNCLWLIFWWIIWYIGNVFNEWIKNLFHQSPTILGREPDSSPLTTTCKSLLFWHYFISHYYKTNFCRSMYLSYSFSSIYQTLIFHSFLLQTSIYIFDNLIQQFVFATSFHYYFVNVDIPMRNLVMEQKCFGQMASFTW